MVKTISNLLIKSMKGKKNSGQHRGSIGKRVHDYRSYEFPSSKYMAQDLSN
jgi:hypothetical protein